MNWIAPSRTRGQLLVIQYLPAISAYRESSKSNLQTNNIINHRALSSLKSFRQCEFSHFTKSVAQPQDLCVIRSWCGAEIMFSQRCKSEGRLKNQSLCETVSRLSGNWMCDLQGKNNKQTWQFLYIRCLLTTQPVNTQCVYISFVLLKQETSSILQMAVMHWENTAT